MLMTTVFFFFLLPLLACIVLVFLYVNSVSRARGSGKHYIGFFHPYCNAGGGGERVLWCAVNSILSRSKNTVCVIYTGDVDASPEHIIQTATSRFNLTIDSSRIQFVYLRSRVLVEAHLYPVFTMILQSLGSVVLGLEAVLRCNPDVMIDSMGYAFTFPIFRLLGRCKVGCYVHYPTISTDMLDKVKNRTVDFNNAQSVSSSSTLSFVKLTYYRIFAWLYGYVGSFSQVIMVNSSWTRGHIQHLWNNGVAVQLVYPPCDVSSFSDLELDGRIDTVVSVAQFRPEKNHSLQLESFALMLRQHPELKSQVKLNMIGGCRNQGDEQRVQALHHLAKTLDLHEHDDYNILTNVDFSILKMHLGSSKVGIHTMKDEHFGIGVVEFLASGAIALAHDSAGPRMDIVVPYKGKITGFLATTVEEYAEKMYNILSMNDENRRNIQVAARSSLDRFSQETFSHEFHECIKQLMK